MRRWVDQFTKLHLWNLTEYERIVYMDSDALPLANTEELFSIELNQQSRTNPSYNYSFAAVPTLGGKITDNEGEIELGSGFNAGVFILKPDAAMFDRIWERAMAPGHPWSWNNDMEQGLLNDFFAARNNGVWPFHKLEWYWNGKDLPDRYLPETKIAHSRYVSCVRTLIVRWWEVYVGLKQNSEWWKTLGQVEGFWESPQ